MFLDPALNIRPHSIKTIHLMGICGTGVGALAGMLKAQGYTVTGSDQNIYPPMSDFLAGLDIEVMPGYRPENLHHHPDLVIVGNVISRDNPEAVALAENNLPYLSMPQALGHFFLNDKTSLVVSGTHGKTTTSSMLSTMLHYCNQDPGFMIGGIVQEFSQNFRIGNGPYFVVEGDEYDTAFFDKGPKFLHYQAKVCILTSVEFDHADIYEDLAAIKQSFQKLITTLPPDGLLVANFDDPNVREVCNEAQCTVLRYGESPESDWQLTDLDVRPQGTKFTLKKSGQVFGQFETTMPGRHNAMNSTAVLAVLDYLEIPVEQCIKSLKRFPGVRRRQEVRGEINDITVIDDFAHHPTAVRETLNALRDAYKGRRLLAVFEPRTNTSRRKIFQTDYIPVFDTADLVLVKEPDLLANISPQDHFSAQELVHAIKKRKKNAFFFANTDQILHYLGINVLPGDVVVVLSNGGFDNIHNRLLTQLKKTDKKPEINNLTKD